ncbi:MAG TPA: M48 family metalloprotease [bacterium]|nr:M48 family metalloprotease [bacterium]
MRARDKAAVGLLLASAIGAAGCATCGIAPLKGDDPFSRTVNSVAGTADDAVKRLTDAVDKITPQDERALGQASSFKVISENGGLLLDATLVEYVNEVGNAVAENGGGKRNSGEKKPPRTKARRFFFGVLNDDSMNAYSLPGGYIFVTRGLVQSLSSESELAWVLGHEIVHVDEEHNLTALKAVIAGKAFAHEAGGITRNLLDPAHAKAGDSAQGDLQSEEIFGKLAGKVSEIALTIGLNKDQESTADRMGLDYSTKAGYDAKGAERVLQLLAANPTRSHSFLSQHDTPEQRLAALAQQIAEKTAKNPGKVGDQRFEDRGFRGIQMAVAQAAAQKAAGTDPKSNDPKPATDGQSSNGTTGTP